MQAYINQLLEEIANAEREEQVRENVSEEQAIEEHFAEVERYLEHDPEKTFGYHCGLEHEQFPPAEKLTKKQQLQIIKAFMQLLSSWNLDADLPKKLPADKRYTMLVSLLNRKTDIVNSGFMTFEFCHYEPLECPFEQYCTCKDFLDSPPVNLDLPEGDLPF